MKLREYVITYRENGKIKANLIDYYEDFIKPLDSRFKDQSFENRLVLCFFKDHEDTDPSLGWMKDRFHKDVLLYHCFGCGKSGDVVRLHQIIEEQYHGNRMDEKQACLDLAYRYNIPVQDFEDIDEDDYGRMYMRTLDNLEHMAKKYSVQDYNYNLLELRKKGDIDLTLVNREIIKLVAISKQLVE